MYPAVSITLLEIDQEFLKSLFLRVHREDIKLCMMQFIRVLKENNNAHHHPL